MSHSPIFDRLRRVMSIARYCDHHRISTTEGLERVEAAISRRRLLVGGALGAASLALPRSGGAARPAPIVDVAIVGAGLAGLACADALAARGVHATVYESRDRIGGRQWSMGGAFGGPVSFPGQVVERGGELIDNLHKTMLGYAKRFRLGTEDVNKAALPGEVFWYFDGQRIPEAVIVDEFRALVDAMRPDLTRLSSEVTASRYTAFDAQLDHTSLADYLHAKGAGRYIRAAIDVSYNIEYGREISEQSVLNFIFFIHADKRARFTPFGVFSDERYHLTDGNEAIAQRLAAGLTGPRHLGTRLLRVARTSGGRVELTLSQGGPSFTRLHDAVVLAIPFSTLRQVTLDANLGLSPEKRAAISQLRYGTNAKLNVGFNGRFWGAQGSNGVTYSQLPNHQCTWEVNPSRASAANAVLVDYSGGLRGEGLRSNQTDRETARFLGDLDRILPGAALAAKSTGANRYLSHLQHWPSDPHALGSYTCNHPGYFTTIAGHEGTPEGNLFFAGEHTDSFYEWQGFMEGAANSGIRAAGEILAAFR